MAKKGKRNIKALIAKRTELEALNNRSALRIPGAPKTPPAETVLTPTSPSATVTLPTHHAGREIWRTTLATITVAVVLTAVVIADRQSPFLETLGTKVYETLRLGD